MASYNLDLTIALPAMTWRRFSTLLHGLPSDSVLVQYMMRPLEPETLEEMEAHLAQHGW